MWFIENKFGGWIYGTSYRVISKLLHKLHLHYAPPSTILEGTRVQLWCQWCGFRETYPVKQWKVMHDIKEGVISWNR